MATGAASSPSQGTESRPQAHQSSYKKAKHEMTAIALVDAPALDGAAQRVVASDGDEENESESESDTSHQNCSAAASLADTSDFTDDDIPAKVPIEFRIGLGGEHPPIFGSVDREASIGQFKVVLKKASDAKTMEEHILAPGALLILADSDIDPFVAGEDIPKQLFAHDYAKIMRDERVRQRVKQTKSVAFMIVKVPRVPRD